MQIPVPGQYYRTFTKWMRKSALSVVVYMSVCAFVIYTCMYGFRKPYTVGTFSNVSFLGIDYKVCLVIAQVMGYMISKFFGIRFIGAMKPRSRARYILICIAIAWVSLFFFAIIPPPYNLVCLFINGLPLGLVFGLVFGFLEGRRTTEIMGAFLVTSFIFASGLAKTTGKWLLLYMHVNEWWMPFAAGGFFVLPLLFFTAIIHRSPPPDETDIAQRTVRKPMDSADRKLFLMQFGKVMAPVVIAYSVFTIVRDFSEDFANDLWIETGYDKSAGIFTGLSLITSLVAIIVIGSFFLFRNNFSAFKATHYLVIAGVSLSVIATLLYNMAFYSPVIWMLLATSGLYMAYLPFNCLYFERMLSAYQIRGNVGFVMYIADAFGYLGTVLVLLIKEFVQIQYSWSTFFSGLFYVAGLLGVLLIAYTLTLHLHLYRKLSRNE